jgi:hypothetical protein
MHWHRESFDGSSQVSGIIIAAVWTQSVSSSTALPLPLQLLNIF